MPHLVVLALGLFLLWLGFRCFRREADRVDTALRRAERRLRRQAEDRAAHLRLDPMTGFYHPAD
jgi:hypothetical protein